MPCATCGDKGVIALNWSDAEWEYALCLCRAGLAWRRDTNGGKSVAPLWRVWCAQHQVEPAKVHRMEHVLTVEELAERGFAVPTSGVALDAIVAAAKGKGKL